MKRTVLRLFLAVLMVSALGVGASTAQDRFGLESAVKTGEKITIDGKAYDVFATAKSGSQFIKLTSSHGNVYALWIGKPTGQVVDGKEIRVTSTGKHFIFAVSKNGNPYNKYLK